MGAYPKEKQGGSSPPEEGLWSQINWRRVGICVLNLTIIVLVTAAVAGGVNYVVWRSEQLDMLPEYSVSIDAVTGLDPATDTQQGRGVLSPVFNLTIGLTSHSAFKGGCIKPGTSIRVSYSSLRLPLAAGRAPEMCVGRRPSSERRAAVARGRDVAIPGFLADTLAEELRRGEAVFEVKIMSMDDEDGEWDVLSCLVRAGAAATSKTCRRSSKPFDSVPVTEQGDSGHVPRPVPADPPVQH